MKKFGHWIKTELTSYGAPVYRCSVCNEEIDEMPLTEEGKPRYKGCPYCLSLMKEEPDHESAKGGEE